jgi:uncharacterized protein
MRLPIAPVMPRALRTLDPVLARRLILRRRQRLAGPLPAAPAGSEGDGREAIMATASDLAGLQDPISVVAPSHLLVLWSRLGRFDPAGAEALRWEKRRLFEHWTHAAAPLLMRRYRSLER